MRKLNFGDSFKMMQIIKAAGVKKELEILFSESKGKSGSEETEEMGIKLFTTVIDGCGSAGVEEKVYSLLAGIIGKTSKEVEQMELGETINIIKEIIKNNNITLFFKQAGQLT